MIFMYRFFICSGYLYQKGSKVDSLASWSRNICKKACVLGVPYFAFSILTWILKKIFSDSVNQGVGSLTDILFLHPISPYWYLYALFFIFLITPTFRNKGMQITGLAIAMCFKIVEIIRGGAKYRPFRISSQMKYGSLVECVSTNPAS